jgi:Flp pilus assembly protein TadD
MPGCFGMISIFSGDLSEALAVIARAARLSPQTIAWVNYHNAHARAWTGDDSGALTSARVYIAASPHDPWGHIMLAIVHGFAGRPDDARRAVAGALRENLGLNADEVRRAHRYRDPARLERVLNVLAAAGLPG